MQCCSCLDLGEQPGSGIWERTMGELGRSEWEGNVGGIWEMKLGQESGRGFGNLSWGRNPGDHILLTTFNQPHPLNHSLLTAFG